MYVRAILMALPLAIGTACSTTQSRSNPSAHTATASSGQTEGNVTTSEPKTAAEPNTSPTSPSDQTASSSAGQAEGNVTTSEPKTATEPDTSPSTSSSASSSPSGSASAADVTRDPIMEPGDEVQAHAGDEVVSGTITRVSRRTLVIASDTGEQKTLFLAPETSIEVDGQDARRTDLQEGQDVRASFNEVNGRDIAVKVRVGDEASSTTELGGSSATPESGSSGSSWDRGPGGTGTPSEPGNTGSDTSSDTSPGSGTSN